MIHAAAAISPDWDRAVAYGDGLFETIAVFDGNAPLWQFHRRRLQHSLHHLQIACDICSIERDFAALASRHPESLVKIIVARSGGSRGYDARNASASAVQMQAYPLPRYPVSHRTEGVRLHVCRQRLSQNPALAGIKHLNRLEQVLAASEWDRAVAEEGLILDGSGAVIEGTMSNIFVLKDGGVDTPRLDHCGVAGVMRSMMMQQLAPSLSLPVRQQRLTIADLLAADAVYVCNSVFGIWPVRAIGVSDVSQSVELTEKFWQLLMTMGYARLYG